MKSKRSTEIKVGIVSVVSILLFIIGMSLTGNLSVSVSQQLIKLRFPNSGGITQTSPVFVNGVKRGEVTTVKNDNGSVLICASIDEVGDLRSDVSAKIMILEITGGKKIEISPGTGSEKFDIKREIKGKPSADIADLVFVLGEVGTDAQFLIKKLDTILTATNNIIGDEKFQNQVKQTVDNTSQLVATLNQFVNNNINDLEISIRNIKSLTQDLKAALQKYDPKLDTVFTKLNVTIDQTQDLLNNTNRAIAGVEDLVNDLKKISNDLRNGDGFATKLLFDKEFAVKMDSTINNLSKFIWQVKEYGLNANIRLGTRP